MSQAISSAHPSLTGKERKQKIYPNSFLYDEKSICWKHAREFIPQAPQKKGR